MRQLTQYFEESLRHWRYGAWQLIRMISPSNSIVARVLRLGRLPVRQIRFQFTRCSGLPFLQACRYYWFCLQKHCRDFPGDSSCGFQAVPGESGTFHCWSSLPDQGAKPRHYYRAIGMRWNCRSVRYRNLYHRSVLAGLLDGGWKAEESHLRLCGHGLSNRKGFLCIEYPWIFFRVDQDKVKYNAADNFCALMGIVPMEGMIRCATEIINTGSLQRKKIDRVCRLHNYR